MQNFTAIFEPAEEGGYDCWVEEIPEAMSQGETLNEAKANLLDALKLLMEANREQAEAGLQGRSVIRRTILNKMTRKVFQDTDKGRNLIRCKDAQDMFKKLGI